MLARCQCIAILWKSNQIFLGLSIMLQPCLFSPVPTVNGIMSHVMVFTHAVLSAQSNLVHLIKSMFPTYESGLTESVCPQEAVPEHQWQGTLPHDCFHVTKYILLCISLLGCCPCLENQILRTGVLTVSIIPTSPVSTALSGT